MTDGTPAFTERTSVPGLPFSPICRDVSAGLAILANLRRYAAAEAWPR